MEYKAGLNFPTKTSVTLYRLKRTIFGNFRDLSKDPFLHDSCQSIVKSGDSIKMHNALLSHKQKESFRAQGSSIICVTDFD